MKTFALPLAAAAMSLPATAAHAAEVQMQASGPVVDLTISENVSASPDVVRLSAGVETLAMTASEALNSNAEKMQQVIAAIEAQGVDEKDIRTSAISLNPRYDYDGETRQQVFRGYEVNSTVRINLRDLTRTGRVLDAVVTAGATDIGSIVWDIEDSEEAEQQAREAAFSTGRERALGFARAAGYSDVRLLEVREGSNGNGRPQPFAADAAIEARNATMPIRPGQLQTGVTISVKYEMVR